MGGGGGYGNGRLKQLATSAVKSREGVSACMLTLLAFFTRILSRATSPGNCATHSKQVLLSN